MALFRTCINIQKIRSQSHICSLINPSSRQSFSVYFLPKKRSSICNVYALKYHTTSLLMKRRKTADERKSNKLIEYSPKAKGELVDVWRGITVAELAEVLGSDTKYIRDLFLGKIKGGNTTQLDDLQQLQEAIRRGGRRMQIVGRPQDNVSEPIDEDVYPQPPAQKSELKPRPPVVTVMGHVDHGKTTLLDALRDSHVVEQEFGGITQHIGAFSVVLKSGAKITFLDTPGHAAFTSMRERGANITDIVVLVVAADDGVMEQTVESIRMAKDARVPILVAINKIDAKDADIERTKDTLVVNGIQVESLGGDVQAIPISALKRQNLDQLTEALVLQADLLEVKADYTGLVEAVVVESRVHPHRGRLCTVIVQRGTLKRGDVLVADTNYCKVRSLRDAEGNVLSKTEPGNPVEIEGWRSLPPAGEIVLQVQSEKRAKEVIKIREDKKMLQKQEQDAIAIAAKLEQHNKSYKERLEMKRKMGRFRMRPIGQRQKEIPADDDGIPKLNLVIKADVDGSLEALLNTLDTYDSHECVLDLVHYGVGAISENDIEMAKAFNGIIYAFNVDTVNNVQDIAEESSVPIKYHNIIYKLIDDVKSEINSRLPPNKVEDVIGEATILQLFDISDGRKKVTIAGSRCTKGILKRSAMYRLIRNEEVIFNGMLSSMRHLKDEVDTIKKDLECGLQLSDKTVVFQPGDTLVCYETKLEPQKTSWDPGF